ncbi:class I SAM-dependent methyltransferase [Paenibacillus kobensis]|uniref:class I SAM-dependent methyltransferase n=1 Tax=Paenibacillus kobensis TaxID=59841 RepID=UPI000FDCC9AF|nr:class I SAM-dependent methyltransferase [Paenibacillus kobensis]
MPDHDQIYSSEAAAYHQMIARQPSLEPYIREIRPIDGLDIVDLGAGTGRFAVMLAPRAKSLTALDASAAMLDITAQRLTGAGLTNWTTKTADNRSLPLADSSADLIVAGWTVCYVAESGKPDWENNLAAVIAEMKRVLRPGGTIILFETMGTGTETPDPPHFLKEYYKSLVEQYGFSHRWIRTDYQFGSLAEAKETASFFFSDELANRVETNNWVSLPECAGIWWLHV